MKFSFLKHLLRKARHTSWPYVLNRLGRVIRAETDRWIVCWHWQRITAGFFLKMFGVSHFNEVWVSLGLNIFPQYLDDFFKKRAQKSKDRIFREAERACALNINLLGSNDCFLGNPIQWHKDFVSGKIWEPRYRSDIDYLNPSESSDVKIPWEISRLQWTIPLAQAYLLSGDEKYAVAARSILESWIDHNPYASSVNWVCPMEAALRLFSWGFLFHIFRSSLAWSDEPFRIRWLRMFYLHAFFVERYIERSPMNENHFVSDAAGLVFASAFFQRKGVTGRWFNQGLKALEKEIRAQYSQDGVHFEASSSYHALVTELFFWAACAAQSQGVQVSSAYCERLYRAACFIEAYTFQPSSYIPLWGDQDEGRVLPFESERFLHHRFLAQVIPDWLEKIDDGLSHACDRNLADGSATRLRMNMHHPPGGSECFMEGGVVILRNAENYCFIDAANVGMHGLGGHGHNDALSFSLILEETPWLIDLGTYTYTRDIQARNDFRRTQAHNTVLIDGKEMNRWVDPQLLWRLHDDVRVSIESFEKYSDRDVAVVYLQRYGGDEGLSIRRRYVLNHETHSFDIETWIFGEGLHQVEMFWHFDSEVSEVERQTNHSFLAKRIGKILKIEITYGLEQAIENTIESSFCSPHYGIKVPNILIRSHFSGALPFYSKVHMQSMRGDL